MSDPLSAISLASAIVQFTDFGIKLVKTSIKLYDSADGVNPKLAELEGKINLVYHFADTVTPPFPQGNSGTAIPTDTQELHDLTITCKSIAEELRTFIKHLSVESPAGPRRKWESVSKAVRAETPWNQRRLASLSAKLHDAQENLFRQVQIMMSAQQSRVLMTLKELADETLLQMKNEIIHLIEQSREENSNATSKLSEQLLSLAETSQKEKTCCILDSLDFDTRKNRQSEVPDPEQHTFRWIFEDFHRSSNKPVGLRKWLTSGDNVYWISGKPGSGKSVLMNYISGEPYTRDLLQLWAGNSTLVTARYFFWNAGATMQKSQQGLLQSLLREIYGQCPDLVPKISTSQWNRCHDIGGAWSRRELTQAFSRLSQETPKIKFCFFIDGIDEYGGDDHTHIIEVLKTLSNAPSVKVCLSSRPWNIFVAAFGSNTSQRLTVEDHTGSDIQRYIKRRLEKDELFRLLQLRESRSRLLMNQIARNAQGVFLWVSLLLRGLSNNDNLIDLQKRLRRLPVKLTPYFQHMFDTIDDFYRETTAEMMLICLNGIQPISLLTIWFYQQERATRNYALEATPNALEESDVIAIYREIYQRVNALGQDLLVIETNDDPDEEDLLYHPQYGVVPLKYTAQFRREHLKYTVQFVHLTIKDFLSRPSMLKQLSSWVSTGFDARRSLCRAALASIKSLPNTVFEYPRRQYGHWWNHLEGFFEYAHLLEGNGGFVEHNLLDEVQHVIATSLVRNSQDGRPTRLLVFLNWIFDRWILYPSVVTNKTWPDKRDTLSLHPPIPDYDDDMSVFFIILAVEAKLNGYVKHKLTTKPYLLHPIILESPLLDRALRPAPWIDQTCKIDPEMVKLLLTEGADPNEGVRLSKFRRGDCLGSPTAFSGGATTIVEFGYKAVASLRTIFAIGMGTLPPSFRVRQPPASQGTHGDSLLTPKYQQSQGQTATPMPEDILASSLRSSLRGGLDDETMAAYAWTTVWTIFLQSLHEAVEQRIKKSPEHVQAEIDAAKIMIESGAHVDLRPWRQLIVRRPFGGPSLSPSDVFHEVFPRREADLLDQLGKQHRPWFWWQLYIYFRRTVQLWHYRNTWIIVRVPGTIFPIVPNLFMGIIVPVVITPTILAPTLIYSLFLAWPFSIDILRSMAPVLIVAIFISIVPIIIVPALSYRLVHYVWQSWSLIPALIYRITPFVLLTIILSDWIPVVEFFEMVQGLIPHQEVQCRVIPSHADMERSRLEALVLERQHRRSMLLPEKTTVHTSSEGIDIYPRTAYQVHEDASGTAATASGLLGWYIYIQNLVFWVFTIRAPSPAPEAFPWGPPARQRRLKTALKQ